MSKVTEEAELRDRDLPTSRGEARSWPWFETRLAKSESLLRIRAGRGGTGAAQRAAEGAQEGESVKETAREKNPSILSLSASSSGSQKPRGSLGQAGPCGGARSLRRERD